MEFSSIRDKYHEKPTLTKGPGLKKRTAVIFFGFLLSFTLIGLTFPAKATGTAKVSQDFLTIQQAIDACPPGGTVSVPSGTYHENITVWKPLTVKGEDRDTTIIEQTGAFAVCRITSGNVVISGFTIRGGSIGIWIDSSGQNTVIDSNVITNNDDGIWVTSSNGSLIGNNIITENLFMGLYIDNSNSTISNSNTINSNTYGIYTENSRDSSILGNTISQNYGDGFHAINSNNNVLFNNLISNNTGGIYLESSGNNLIYQNNLIFNDNQAWADITTANSWDNGYPSGGNCWSNYTGNDIYSGPYQNETGSDGIGDVPYVIGANNQDRYPLMKTHDIGIQRVTTSKTVVGQGYSVAINVEITDYGINSETFNVTAYINTISIANQTVTLGSGSSTTTTFVWNTSGFAKGNYVISAYAWPVPGETHTADNRLIDGTVHVGIAGDMNVDGIVDMTDIGLIALAYGSGPGDPRWKPNADITGNGFIDMTDIGYAALNYGKQDP
jgi:parallel beta-helix repeat protein